MKFMSIFIATFMCGFVIFLAELPTKQVYDCKFVSYPVAIDVPQTVIHQCQKKGLI
jgi:hypothetical protein